MNTIIKFCAICSIILTYLININIFAGVDTGVIKDAVNKPKPPICCPSK